MNDDMSEDQSAAAADTPPAVPTRSPGVMIREARERARISIEDLASQIKLARHTLEALERDDFSQLLEPVYVRGYYRKCAKVLNLSENELIDAYHGLAAPKQPMTPSKLRLASGTELGSDNRLPVAMSVVFVIIAILVCTVIWNMRSTTPPPVLSVPVAPPPMPAPTTTIEGDATSPTASGDQAATNAAGTTDAAAATAPATTSTDPAATPAATAPAAHSNPAQAPAAAAMPPAGTTATPASTTVVASGPTGSVTLAFTATSWVSIEDASGKTLLNGLLHAGDSRVLSGVLPLKVFLGNAPAVTVQYEGQTVDVSKRVAENLTVRFTLPLQPKP